MTHKAATLFALATLALAPALSAEALRGGAVPTNLSFYESNEFADVQWAAAREAEPVWGSLVLEGADGLRFVPDNGIEVKMAYSDIKAIRYERVVQKKEKAVDQKWYQRPFAFAKGVDTYRTITIQHRSGEGSTSSIMRVDGLNAAGIVRVLEIKTGLRAKKLSSL